MLANGNAYSFGPLGVFFTRRDGSPMPVCGPLEVIAKVRSSEGEDWRLALKWTDQDGHFRQGLIPLSALMKTPLKWWHIWPTMGLKSGTPLIRKEEAPISSTSSIASRKSHHIICLFPLNTSSTNRFKYRLVNRICRLVLV